MKTRVKMAEACPKAIMLIGIVLLFPLAKTQAEVVRRASHARSANERLPGSEPVTGDETSEERLQCLLVKANEINKQKIANGTGSKHTPITTEKSARVAGTVFAAAIRAMAAKYPRSIQELSHNSLLALMDFVIEESGAGKAMAEMGRRTSEKKGFGYIQITTSGERAKVAKCMEQVKPGSSAGVVLRPAQTLTKPPIAALASLCYWKIHFIDDHDHRRSANMSSERDGMETVLRLMNSGKPNGQVMDRASHHFTHDASRETKRRLETFRSLESAAQACRKLVKKNASSDDVASRAW